MLYATPGATRHPLLKKGASLAPFLGRGWRVAPGVVYKLRHVSINFMTI